MKRAGTVTGRNGYNVFGKLSGMWALLQPLCLRAFICRAGREGTRFFFPPSGLEGLDLIRISPNILSFHLLDRIFFLPIASIHTHTSF